jgi:hypothetical protein
MQRDMAIHHKWVFGCHFFYVFVNRLSGWGVLLLRVIASNPYIQSGKSSLITETDCWYNNYSFIKISVTDVQELTKFWKSCRVCHCNWFSIWFYIENIFEFFFHFPAERSVGKLLLLLSSSSRAPLVLAVNRMAKPAQVRLGTALAWQHHPLACAVLSHAH